MLKINSDYFSPFEYIVNRKSKFSFLSPKFTVFDKYFYPDEQTLLEEGDSPEGIIHRRWQPPSRGFLVGSLQPLVNMYKDFTDTFKPYRSLFHLSRDLASSLRGLGNIIVGTFNVASAALLFVTDTVRYTRVLFKEAPNMSFQQKLPSFQDDMISNVTRATGWFVDGLCRIARGVTQIAATPLTVLVKAPLRSLITAITGVPTFESRGRVQTLAKEYKSVVESLLTDQAKRQTNSDFQNACDAAWPERAPYPSFTTYYNESIRSDIKKSYSDHVRIELYRKAQNAALSGEKTALGWQYYSKASFFGENTQTVVKDIIDAVDQPRLETEDSLLLQKVIQNR